MNSIKKITIENFQSHQKTTITPGSKGQLTVITGPSDAGKTVILRALKWLLFNEPQGADFIRVGTSFSRVSAELENENVVIRHRTAGGTNRYMVNGNKFEGFGYSVPLEVQDLTGVRPVKIGDLDVNLNLADQLAGPFLGSSISAGARAKVLGKLAGTEEIDFAGKELGTDLYRRNQEARRLDVEVSELGVLLKGFDWLPEMAVKIAALEELAGRIKAAQEREVKLASLLRGHVSLGNSLRIAQGVLRRLHGLGQAEGLVSKVDTSRQRQEGLTALASRYVAYEQSIASSKQSIISLAGVDDAGALLHEAQNAAGKINLLKGLAAKHNADSSAIAQLKTTLARLTSIYQSADKLQDAIVFKQQVDSLATLAGRYKVVDAAATTAQKQLDALASISAAEKSAKQATDDQVRWARLYVLRDRHIDFTDKIDAARGQAVVAENRVHELKGAYHDLLDAAGICPTCGQEICQESKSKMIKEAV